VTSAGINDFPISCMQLHVNMKKQETISKAKDEQYALFYKFQKFANEINENKEGNNNRVLVHCAMGMSRSATGAIMFLMKLFQCGFDDVFEFVKTQRQETDPNEGFIEQLRRFETQQWQFIDKPIIDVAAIKMNAQIEAEAKALKLI
jgi:dual specificity phosphatase 12